MNDMGQQEIYNFLKENKGKYFRTKDIIKATNMSNPSKSLKILVLKKMIGRKFTIFKNRVVPLFIFEEGENV